MAWIFDGIIEDSGRSFGRFCQKSTNRKSVLTLGISLLHYDDLLLLHQTDVLEPKAQEIIAKKNKELRESYERATVHRYGLQNTEKELEKFENALLQHELELETQISDTHWQIKWKNYEWNSQGL